MGRELFDLDPAFGSAFARNGFQRWIDIWTYRFRTLSLADDPSARSNGLYTTGYLCRQLCPGADVAVLRHRAVLCRRTFDWRDRRKCDCRGADDRRGGAYRGHPGTIDAVFTGRRGDGGGSQLPLADAETAISGYEDSLSVAAVNGPRDIVLSGTAESRKRLQELEKHGISVRRLTVSHAFHSPLMTPILDDFAAAVSD